MSYSSSNQAYTASNSSGRLDRAMQPEQFSQVLDAILAGKYSWACVLILRFAGYNPLHYIPYRTYNRIVKDNTAPKKRSSSDDRIHQAPMNGEQKSLSSIQDLHFLDQIREESNYLNGGKCFFGLIDFASSLRGRH
ncbi:MAG: hypothetical protein B0A82_18140 [Alkalinema sp. CACIAM 70d]|nr:MAG: hypothetical protein B0A82_18140 [Alkalinema sp. CACIAM 70d]